MLFGRLHTASVIKQAGGRRQQRAMTKPGSEPSQAHAASLLGRLRVPSATGWTFSTNGDIKKVIFILRQTGGGNFSLPLPTRCQQNWKLFAFSYFGTLTWGSGRDSKESSIFLAIMKECLRLMLMTSLKKKKEKRKWTKLSGMNPAHPVCQTGQTWVRGLSLHSHLCLYARCQKFTCNTLCTCPMQGEPGFRTHPNPDIHRMTAWQSQLSGRGRGWMSVNGGNLPHPTLLCGLDSFPLARWKVGNSGCTLAVGWSEDRWGGYHARWRTCTTSKFQVQHERLTCPCILWTWKKDKRTQRLNPCWW